MLKARFAIHMVSPKLAMHFISKGARKMKNDVWVFYKDIEPEKAGEGVVRRVLAYSDDIMVVENTFSKDAIGQKHSHPHTQITYVKSGRFLFTIGDTTREVTEGDTLLKTDGVVHGCVCLEAGVLLDIFSPYREDFVKD